MTAVLESSPQTRPVRIGAVCFLNTRPLVEGLEKCRDAELSFDVPSRLLGALLEERADLALAPIVDALQSPEPLAVATVGCIASEGPTESVKLFSRVPFSDVTSVVTDPDSKTSVALSKVLLTKRFSAMPTFERAAAPVSGAAPPAADAMLMIGDKVERDPPDAATFPHTLDLGQAWTDWTGLPFVYAAWVCQASRANDPIVRRGLALLDHQRRHNTTRLDWIATRRAAEHGWGVPEAVAYLSSTIRGVLGPREREAVERFAHEAAAVGAVAQSRPIAWI